MNRTRLMMMVATSAALAFAGAGCGDNAAECGAGTVEVDGVCVPSADACEAGTTFNPATNKCEGASCATGTVLVNGECLPDGSVICETGTAYDEETGTCVPDISGCAAGTVLVDGECVPEDETLTADVEEPAEPNGFGESNTPGQITLPAVGGSVTVHGCVNPFEDTDMNGNLDPDFDAFVIQATGPTLLEVTADGVGGLAAGFLFLSAEEALLDWQRYGINLTGDTSMRQVFLPTAGIYVLAMTDSRSFFADAAGSPEACYYTTIKTLPLPTPTPIGTTSPVSGPLTEIAFYSYQSPIAGGVIDTLLTVGSDVAFAETVYLKTNTFRAFAQEGVPLAASSLATTDTAVFVADYVYNYALSPKTYVLAFRVATVTPDPGDGTSITLTHDDANPGNLVSFEGTAGDIVHLTFDAAAVGYDITVFPPNSTTFDYFSGEWIGDLCFGCDDIDTFIQLQATGTYYLRVQNLDAVDTDTYDVAFTRAALTPSALTIDTPATGKTINAEGVDFYVLDGSMATWLLFQAANTTLTGELQVRLFDRAGEGTLGQMVPIFDGMTITSEAAGRVVIDDDLVYLVAVSDNGDFGGGSVYDLSVATRAYTTIPTIAPGASFTETAAALAADGTNLYFMQTTANQIYKLDVTGTSGTDLVLRRLNREEGDLASVDNTFDAGTESLIFAGDGGWVALAIGDFFGSEGAYDLTLTALVPSVTGTSTPALEIPDNDTVTGVTDALTTTGTCASITLITVDVDISHTFRGDLNIYLESPDGTVVQLQRSSFDSQDDLVGTYPLTFTPFESLDTFAGENGIGTWTLSLFDTFAVDVGTLNSWGVTLYCD